MGREGLRGPLGGTGGVAGSPRGPGGWGGLSGRLQGFGRAERGWKANPVGHEGLKEFERPSRVSMKGQEDLSKGLEQLGGPPGWP